MTHRNTAAGPDRTAQRRPLAVVGRRTAGRTRGQTASIGYILSFAVVMIAVAFVYTQAPVLIQDAQHTTQLQTASRAFDVLASQTAELHTGYAPQRATEVDLAGGSLGFGTPVTFTVNVTDPSGNTTSLNRTTSPLSYTLPSAGSASPAQLTYTSGLVLRASGDRPLVEHTPPFVFQPNHTALTLASLRGTGSISGSSNVLIVSERTSTTTLLTAPSQTATTGVPPDTRTVTITVDGPPTLVAGWHQYFTTHDADLTVVAGTPADGSITVEYQTRRVLIRETILQTHFEH